MNVSQLLDSKMMIFDVVAGSHAYGTNIATSDVDHRGLFMLPDEYYLNMNKPPEQISDETNDTTYYSLKRFFELTAKATPNTLELLWMPDDMVEYESEAFKYLKDHRDMFISKKCYYTFTGYAHAQIKKAKGQNKWVNNPQPMERPSKWDFCYYIEPKCLKGDVLPDFNQLSNTFNNAIDWDAVTFPMRPKKSSVMHGIIKFKHYHASKMEHCRDVYRVYDYTDQGGKGIFRGSSEQLVLESIPKEDEFARFAGILIFNEDAFERAVRDHKHYWEWVNNRNEARWTTQEAGEIDYDAKNMLHCVRLIKSSRNILETGNPIVRFNGEDLQYLMDIRKGKFKHEEIMEYCQDELVAIEYLYQQSSDIPDKVDMNAIQRLYTDIRSEYT